MKNNHLKIAANKEPKLPQGGEKIIPCKLKKWGFMAMLGAASLLALNSCGKDEPQQQLQTVEYTFGSGYWDEIYPASKLSGVGADKNIGTIKIKSDGKSWGRLGTDDILRDLDPAFEAANGKGTGDKTEVNNVTVMSIDDSLKFVKYGYLVNVKTW
jgi:hypothetical protein